VADQGPASSSGRPFATVIALLVVVTVLLNMLLAVGGSSLGGPVRGIRIPWEITVPIIRTLNHQC